MDCINKSTESNSNSSTGNNFDATLLFTTFLTTSLFLNILLIIILLADDKLLRRTFSWFIFFQSLFDSLSLVLQAIGAYKVFDSTDLLASFLVSTFFEVVLNSSMWMTAYRSFVQKRIASTMMLAVSHQSNDKLRALRSSLKVFVPLWLAVALCSFLLPTGRCKLILQMYFTGYPDVGNNWNYFLILSNCLVFYFPMAVVIVCSLLTIFQLEQLKRKNSTIFHQNALLQARYARRRQTTIILISYMVLFVVLVFPLQVWRFYLFFNTYTETEHMWHIILNYLSYLYFTANPIMLFLLSAELRKPFTKLKVEIFNQLFRETTSLK